MDEIKSNKADYTAIVAKGALGAIPYVGAMLAEIIGTLIPNQRMDRISRFLEKLEGRIGRLESEPVKTKLGQSNTIDLIEDAFLQAARAVSDDRLEYLSVLLAGSITDDSLSYEESKRLLAILSELNDVEVIILASYDTDRHPQRDPNFWERHKTILSPRVPTMGASERELEEAAIHKSYRQHLVQLQLLKPTFRSVRRGEQPEFDDSTGMMKTSGYDSTVFGRLLLRRIEMAKSEVPQQG